MNFGSWLLEMGHDEHLALITQESEHRYGELRRAVGAVSRFLANAGVVAGDCVALIAESSFFGIAAYLGILRSGAVAVPLPTQLSPEHARYIVQTTGLKVAFIQAKVVNDFAPALGAVPLRVLDNDQWSALLAENGPIPPPAATAEDDLAALLFTSGSSSEPRGVMLSHRNLLSNTESILAYLGLAADERTMLVLPFYYSFGASLLHTHLRIGATLVIDRRFMFPDKVLKRMQETRCTGFAGVPSHFQVLLRRSQLKKMQFPDLRWVQQAGGKLPAHFIQELREALPGVRIFVMYGATEATARLCYLPPEQLVQKLGSVGKPIPGVKIELWDEAGQPVPTGTVGEIVASGPNIARGYFGSPPEAATTFRDGKLHTGDLARSDEEGYLFIVDRAKDFIKVGGTRTSAKLLEETLLQFPDIVEAAVLGIPDDALGEAVAVWVVPRQPNDATVEQRLLAFAAEALPAPQVPKQVKVLSALPKNASGKVMKRALRDQPS